MLVFALNAADWARALLDQAGPTQDEPAREMRAVVEADEDGDETGAQAAATVSVEPETKCASAPHKGLAEGFIWSFILEPPTSDDLFG